jgi:TolB-like protein/Tfp pilus assembly protein PilF
MFTDIVGFTAMSQRDEKHGLKVLEGHNNMLRPIFAKHGGTEIKTIGDSFMVEFASALAATECAIEIQRKLAEVQDMEGSPLKVRIGLHLGDVMRRGSDIFGDAVNVASRIQPLAEPGGICISEQVFDQVRNKISRPLLKLAPRTLKNVEFPIDVYRIVMPWEASSTSSAYQETPRSQRIAVLPLTNMSPDPTDEYFADGMTDEIISALSKIEQAEVISRTSVMQYKKAAKSIREVSKELDVGTVLEGSVRKSGNMLRVTVQMIDALRDRHLWAESYDRKLEDVFAIQSDIARRVADALQARMRGSRLGMIEPTKDVEAYTMYLRAMQLHHENTEVSLREAVALFEKAISRDPAFARAYAGLAHALCELTVGYEDSTAFVRKAEAAARKALELEPDSAEVLVAMAYVHTFMDKFDEVISEAEKAIQINSNLSEAYRSLGWIYSSMGKLDAGVRDLQRAYKLDPLSFRPGSEVSLVFQLAGREREAVELLERLRDLYPRNHRVYARWAEFYMLKRDFVNAQKMVSTGLQISPTDVDLLTDQGLLYAFTDRRREAEKILRDIETNVTEASRLHGQVFIHAALRKLDEAFKALQRLAEIHAWPPLIKSLPVFDEMRKDPRFSEFCLSVGLPA